MLKGKGRLRDGKWRRLGEKEKEGGTREVELEKYTEKIKRMQLESQKITEDLNKRRKKPIREMKESRRIYCAVPRS